MLCVHGVLMIAQHTRRHKYSLVICALLGYVIRVNTIELSSFDVKLKSCIFGRNAGYMSVPSSGNTPLKPRCWASYVTYSRLVPTWQVVPHITSLICVIRSNITTITDPKIVA